MMRGRITGLALVVVMLGGVAWSAPSRAGWDNGAGGSADLNTVCQSLATNWGGTLRGIYNLYYGTNNIPEGSSTRPWTYTGDTPARLCALDPLVINGVTTWVYWGTQPKCTTGSEAGLYPNGEIDTGCSAQPPEDFCEVCAGNPIQVASGAKTQAFVDYATSGPNALRFVRYYDSLTKLQTSRPSALGRGWRSHFDRAIRPQPYSSSFSVATTVVAERPSGQRVKFTKSGQNWITENDEPERLTQTTSGWELRDADDTLEVYEVDGRLLSIATRGGYQQTLTYAADGKLDRVTDSYGRTLVFQYTGNRLIKLIDNAGLVYRFSYQKSSSRALEDDLLIGATAPDGQTSTYHYEDPVFLSALTGITDPNGNRFATWTYDSIGRAITSQHAGGADLTTIAFNADGTETVINELGQRTDYRFTKLFDSDLVTRMDRVATPTVPAASQTFTYDANGYRASATDWKGNVTSYMHDARGLETSRIEAAGTPQARTITTTWHATLRVPTQIVEPGKTTTFAYDLAGRLLTKTETDKRTQTVPYGTNGQTRSWNYTWGGTGVLLTVNGPRTDVNDTTTYNWTNGVLSSVRNALGQVTTINAVNGRGLPTKITDPNGAVTDLAYNQRGWLTSVTKRSAGGDAATSFEYDTIGQITAIVQPDGVRLDYEYDNAHRLTALRNGQGERIEYTLDAMGNRTAEKIKNSGGAIVKSMTHTYDGLGRLLKNIGAASQTTTYAYDKNDNVTSITDPLNGVTAQAYDALDRLIASTDPANGATDYAYDNQDNLTSVTDPRGIATAYVYDGFGRVIQTASPDAGTTVYVYDKAGNLIEKTDGRGVVAQYGYDALDRVTAKTFAASPADNVTYEYDDPAPGLYGIGRLRRITDKSGATAFAYGSRGNVVQETRTIAATAYVTSYVYDPADRLTQMVYPSGRILNYVRGAMGRVVAATTQANASAPPAAIAYNVAYKPFGPIKTMIYGNGLNRTYTYDSDYRLTGLATGDVDTFVQNLSYGYDAADDILSIADAIATGRSQTFTYDALFRLTQATGSYGTVTYGYDAVGNRTSRVQGALSQTYSYDAFSNRLLSVSGGGTRGFAYDNAGNTVSDDRPGGLYELAYDPAGRLSAVDIDGLPESEYRYNALGERVAKQPPGSPAAATHFHYDRDGRLIAESTASGAVIREYAWLDGLPIGEFTNAGGGSSPAQVLVDNIDGGASSTGDWSPATAGSGYFGADYDKHEPLSGGVPPGGTVIDNASADFATTGIWSTATAPAGFEGTNYLTRSSTDPNDTFEVIVDNGDAGFSATGEWFARSGSGLWANDALEHADNQPSPQEGIIVDNDAAGYSTTGQWLASTAGTGFHGANYRYQRTNQPAPSAAIVDNDAAGTTQLGAWTISTATPRYGANFVDAAGGGGESTYTWTPTLAAAGQYKVFAYWRADTDRATNAPFTIVHNGGSATVTVNQKLNGGKWNLLGTFAMTPGQNHRAVLTNAADGRVIADAVAFSPAGDFNTVRWTPAVPTANQYDVYARLFRSGRIDASTAPYTIVHANGSTTVTKNQVLNAGNMRWERLGTFSLTPGLNHGVDLSDVADADFLYGDAVTISRVGAPAPLATWTPGLPKREAYDVYAWWVSGSTSAYDFATDAPFTVHHEDGATTVRRSQVGNGGTWNLLGSFVMAPGQNHRVELGDRANGYVKADAVRLVPSASAPRTATWYLTPAQTGTYKVFAKWPAAADQATDAPFTVTHAGGGATVTANQRLNGGQWNLLGSFTLTAGTRYKVELSDAATGKVAADAIYYVRDTAPADAFTWTPTLPSAGSWRILVRWPASSANTATARYTVTHAGGTTTVTANQKQNGGVWNSLGTYSLAPGAGHKVTLAASTDGATIADALLFAGPTVQPANLLYVHADHLGSPQKLTDTTQAIAWDGVFDPFGEEVALTGLAAMPMRFPGQYADEETGFSYNYFRDYESKLGRYMQSDPIGLHGGINTYAYAIANPLRRVDPYGLAVAEATSSILWDLITPATEAASTAEALAMSGVAAAAGALSFCGALLYTPTELIPACEASNSPYSCGTPEGAQLVTHDYYKKEQAEQDKEEPAVTKRPTRARKKTLQDAWDDAEDGEAGGKLCPDCGDEVNVPPGEGSRDWDLDHEPKWKDRDLEGLDRPGVLDEYNKGTRLRCPFCNRSDN